MGCKYYEIIGAHLRSSAVALRSYRYSFEVTYAELGGCIGYYQKQLIRCGVTQGDKVVLCGHNSIGWCAAYLAIQYLGAVVVPLSRQLVSDSLEYYLRHCDARAILTDMRGSARLINDTVPAIYLHDVVEESDRIGYVMNERVDDHDVGTIIYTSGTTEQPKGVVLTYESLFLNLKYISLKRPLHEADTLCSCLPFEHSYGCMYNMLYPLAAGADNMIIDVPLSLPVLMDACSRHRPRLLYLVPLYMEKLYALALRQTAGEAECRQCLLNLLGGELREVILGGAALSPEVEQALSQMHFPLGGGYGMTECGPTVSYASSDDYKKGSVGYVIDCLETRLLKSDAEGSGELLVRGGNVFAGYYKDRDSTTRVLDEDGWLHTGDVVRIEVTERGRLLYIVGRCKNMLLLSNGENIYPEQIENMINRMPHVHSSLALCRSNVLIVKVHFESDTDEALQLTLLEEYRERCNRMLTQRTPIARLELQKEDFERTEKKTIKRYLYA